MHEHNITIFKTRVVPCDVTNPFTKCTNWFFLIVISIIIVLCQIYNVQNFLILKVSFHHIFLQSNDVVFEFSYQKFKLNGDFQPLW